MAGLPLRVPGVILAEAVAVAAARWVAGDWLASGLGRWAASRPRPQGFAIQPQDFRPADPDRGRQIMAGAWALAGATLAVGPRGDPFDRPSPSRDFAAALHGFSWLPDLVAAGEAGEGLRLYIEWRRQFGRWNRFAWSAPVLARRTFNLACAGRALAARASDAEIAQMASDLARSGRTLLFLGDAGDAAERSAAAALAGAALAGEAGEELRRAALRRLERALPRAVRGDGGHASRRPEAALELLFDLKTLDEALTQRGLAAPAAVLRAIDGLAAAVRFFTLEDGGLAAFHGGVSRSRGYVAAARADDEAEARHESVELGGYHRIEGRALQLVVDAAGPPRGAFSTAAAIQPVGLEILVGGRRLMGPAAGRGLEHGCTLSVGDAGFGRVLGGFTARALGPRLVDADADVQAERHEQATAIWLEMAHDGWLRRYGVLHQRRLFLRADADELRGEDRLTPTARVQGPDGRHFIPYAARFHLAPGVSALVSQDRRSVLLRAEGDTVGWLFRNDALDVAIEPSLHPSGRPCQQIVLRGHRRADSGARVRWKLSPAQHRVDEPPRAA